MTAEGPQAGLTHSRSLIVDPSVIVPALTPLLGPLTDMPPMLVTACMVGFVEVECRDEKEMIGTGFHERAVIDPARSQARLEEAAG